MSRSSKPRLGPVVSSTLALLVAACSGVVAAGNPVGPAGPSAPAFGRLTLDPFETTIGEVHVMSGLPVSFNGLHINNFLGADRFYTAGITGQGTAVTVLEPGHIWNSHVTLTHVTQFSVGTGVPGEFDRHATYAGMLIGGRKYSVNPQDFQTGIAMNTELRSAAVATGWFPSTPETPRYSLRFNTNATALFSAYQAAFGSSDAINNSWGFVTTDGNHAWTLGVDGLAKAHPGTTLVVGAGNNGPGPNSVSGLATGYNSIAVANLANANDYDVINSGSSRGPQDYRDPIRGLVTGARVAVDIAAPGTTITAAYYGGETGGNSPVLGGSPGGVPGSPSWYVNVVGTSIASPMVSGAVALLDSASYNTPALAPNARSRDARVVKSVLLNSATKIPGWNNGQTLTNGVVTTTQALDYAVGAGRLNIGAAYDQYLSGTRDVTGTGGADVEERGWDFGVVAPSSVTDYPIADFLEGGSTFNVTLSWFRDRTYTNATTASDNAYRDLGLEVWDRTFTTLFARSDSRYENVEHLSFTLPATGQYALRVRYVDTLFGSAADEAYGLAWAGTFLPTADNGDADRDGLITADDYARIDRGFLRRSPGYTNGDFNRDGFVDLGDYAIIDACLALREAP